MNATHWTDLIVTDADGPVGNLGDVLRTAPYTLRHATIEDRIISWPGHQLSAPGETPNWDTPHGPVDWTGFARACGLPPGITWRGRLPGDHR